MSLTGCCVQDKMRTEYGKLLHALQDFAPEATSRQSGLLDHLVAERFFPESLPPMPAACCPVML